ncbi:MAG TPA: hypothetical protein DCX02_03195 [Firmicutes bacterium]|nr:hypothetical protein [Bacillota bacterium]
MHSSIIGSISKIFTAASILTLVQQDKVELDKPVTEYLPEFSMQDERYKDITVRMLLNHTSGLPGTNFKNGFAAEKHRVTSGRRWNCCRTPTW